MTIRKILAVGGDERALLMLPLLRARGYEVRSLGLLEEEGAVADAAWAEALLFPYPFSVKNGMVPTLGGITLYPGDLLSLAGSGTVILAGKGLEPFLAAAGSELRARAYGADQAFVQANAELSAEAAVYEVMRLSGEALSDRRVLVTGYGRFGRATAQRLHGLGAEVTVAARSEGQRLLARSDGLRAVSLEELPEVAPRVCVALNTAPARVFTPDALAAFEKGSHLLELASAPYGFDLALAEKLGLCCKLLPGLPARYAPKSAAKALAAACVRLLEREEGEK